MGKNSARLNNSGVGLVGILVSIGILAISSYLLMTGYQAVFNSKRRVNSQLSVYAIRANLMTVVGSEEGIAQTIAKNPAMQCLNDTSTGCQSYRNTAIPISVYDSAGVKLTDFANVSAGFKPDGTVCTGFSSSGSPQCPFRYNVTWQPLCDPATPASCVRPQSRIVATFSNSSNVLPADVSQTKLGFTIFPSVVTGNSQNQCQAMGGTALSDGSCSLPMFGQTCPQGQVVVSVDNGAPTSQKITCKSLLSGTCADGQVMRGISSSGTVACVPRGYCPKKTRWNDWHVEPSSSSDGADGGDGGDGGCDGTDGTDGCS